MNLLNDDSQKMHRRGCVVNEAFITIGPVCDNGQVDGYLHILVRRSVGVVGCARKW